MLHMILSTLNFKETDTDTHDFCDDIKDNIRQWRLPWLPTLIVMLPVMNGLYGKTDDIHAWLQSYGTRSLHDQVKAAAEHMQNHHNFRT